MFTGASADAMVSGSDLPGDEPLSLPTLVDLNQVQHIYFFICTFVQALGFINFIQRYRLPTIAQDGLRQMCCSKRKNVPRLAPGDPHAAPAEGGKKRWRLDNRESKINHYHPSMAVPFQRH